jgi:FkbM family methyltransferase
LRAYPSSTIFAFEPSKITFNVLSERLSSDKRVTLVNQAAGKVSGYAYLFSDQPASGMASMTKRDLSHIGLSFDHKEKVEVVALGQWCSENMLSSIDVLKLDVEGHELDTIQGLGEMISSIRLVQFEFGGTSLDTRNFFKDYWEILTRNSFAIFRATPHGPMEIPQYEEALEQFAFSTYYAVQHID